MKSPFADADATIGKELRVLQYRKESFEILYHFYVCTETKEQFTTTELDTLNLNQVYNKYRERFGIPFLDEIKEIREMYGLSAVKMSEVLGFGINIYRTYESGEMPSVANGRLIRLASDPKEFLELLEMSRRSLEAHEYEKVKRKIDHARSGWGAVEAMQKFSLFGNMLPNLLNGYRVPNMFRIGNMVRYFAAENQPYTTGLNKLLFYADFGHFKKYGQSISGLQYKAIQRGPVPENYGGIYNQLVNCGFVRVEETDFGDFVGERFVADSFDEAKEEETELFNSTEWELLKLVSVMFKGKTTREIVNISHQEHAWQDNVDDYDRINFEYGFELKNID